MGQKNKLNNLININTKPNFSTDPKVYTCIAWEYKGGDTLKETIASEDNQVNQKLRSAHELST